MGWQNLFYAFTQIAHNLGAVTVVATPLYFLTVRQPRHERGALWLALFGWSVQIVSGILFGLVSYYYYGQMPDIHGIAIVALVVKIGCAIAAVAGIVTALRVKDPQAGRLLGARWPVLAVLALIAISAAAFLRWYS